MKNVTKAIIKGLALSTLTPVMDICAPVTYPLAGAGAVIIAAGDEGTPNPAMIAGGAIAGAMAVPMAPINLLVRPLYNVGVSVALELLKGDN